MELLSNLSRATRTASVEDPDRPLSRSAQRLPAPHDEAAPLAAHIFALMLDHIELGVMVCDGDGRLLHANREARAELDRGRVLAVIPPANPRCQVVHAACGAAAAKSLQAAMQGAAHQGLRRMVALHAGAERLLVNALPLTVGDGEPLVLLLLGARHLCSPLGLEMLASLHGLTSAERRVTAGLASGLNATEIAAEAGVAISTLRSQISTVRSKLGARSVDDLLFRVAGVPRMASAVHYGGVARRAAV
jgi:DNA-binding CsgD family transcriptional regulator